MGARPGSETREPRDVRRLQSGAHAQLRVDVLSVGADGVDRDEEPAGDRPAVEPLRHAGEHTLLSRGQLSDELLNPVQSGVVIQQVAEHRGEQSRCQPGLAPDRAADGAAQLRGAQLLRNEAQSAGAQRGAHGAGVVMTADHHDPHAGVPLAEGQGQVDAVVGADLDVQDGDVGTQRDGCGDRGRRRARPGHHVDAGFDGQARGERLHEHGMVVDHEDPGRFHRDDGIPSRWRRPPADRREGLLQTGESGQNAAVSQGLLDRSCRTSLT